MFGRFFPGGGSFEQQSRESEVTRPIIMTGQAILVGLLLVLCVGVESLLIGRWFGPLALLGWWVVGFRVQRGGTGRLLIVRRPATRAANALGVAPGWALAGALGLLFTGLALLGVWPWFTWEFYPAPANAFGMTWPGGGFALPGPWISVRVFLIVLLAFVVPQELLTLRQVLLLERVAPNLRNSVQAVRGRVAPGSLFAQYLVYPERRAEGPAQRATSEPLGPRDAGQGIFAE